MSLPSRHRVPDRGPVIRPARREDVDALVAIENASFASDRLSRRSFLRLVESPTAIALVAQEASVVGACVMLLRATSRRARLYSLAVDPSATGRGLGSALLDAAEQAAAARGIEVITLEVREDNAAARKLYAGRGFAIFGSVPGYYSDGETALRLHKRLASGAAEAA